MSDSKSKRPGKKRIPNSFDEDLVTLFERQCQRQNITTTEGIRRLIEASISGEPEWQNLRSNRKIRDAKDWPKREIRCMIALLMQEGKRISELGFETTPEVFDLQVKRLFSIERLLQLLEQEEHDVS